MTDARVIVIGAGAAGLMAAITAARRGASVVVLERMAAPGRKLMITGKGRCNITNTCPVPEFLRNLPGNGKFLQGALHRFTNEDVMNLLEENGLPLVHFGNRGLELEIDLKPALDEEKLDARILRDFQEDGKRPLAEALRKLVPQPLVETLLDLSYLDGAKAVSQVSKEERHTLREVLKHFTIPLTGTLPLAAAIVTAGGVSLKEINPKDMSSLLAPGLYFAGEVMDVDGYTGGFNLQAAFSSGHAAGEAAADRALDAVR